MKKQSKKEKLQQQEQDTQAMIIDMQAQIKALQADNELAWYGFNWYREELHREESASMWYNERAQHALNSVCSLKSTLAEVSRDKEWWKDEWRLAHTEVIRLEKKLEQPWWKIVLFGRAK